MTICNYCLYKSILRRVKSEGKSSTLLGNSLYVHPKEVNIKSLSESEREQYFAVWFMELPSYCAC